MQRSPGHSSKKTSTVKDRKDVQESVKSGLTDLNKNKLTATSASSSNPPPSTSRSRGKLRLLDSSSSSGPSHAPSRPSSRHSTSSARDSSIDPFNTKDGQKLDEQLLKLFPELKGKEAKAEKTKKGKEMESPYLSLKLHKEHNEYELIGSKELKLREVVKFSKNALENANQKTWGINIRRNAVGKSWRFAFHFIGATTVPLIKDQGMRDALTNAFIAQFTAISKEQRIRYEKDCDGGKYMWKKQCDTLKEQDFVLETGLLTGPSIKDKTKKRALDPSDGLVTLMKLKPLYIDSKLAITLSFYLAYRDVVGDAAFNFFWHNKVCKGGAKGDLTPFVLKHSEEGCTPHSHASKYNDPKSIEVGQMVYIKGPPSAHSFKPTSPHNGHNVLCVEAGETPMFIGFDSFGVLTKTATEFNNLMEQEYKKPYTHLLLIEFCKYGTKERKKIHKESTLSYGDAYELVEKENGSDNLKKALANAKAVEKRVEKSKTGELNEPCKPEIRMPHRYLGNKAEGCQEVTTWF